MPYWIWKAVLLPRYDELDGGLKRAEPEHCELVHDVSTTQRSDEPVSRMVTKFCAGVPIEICA
jgi:hypothetical protein